MSGKKDPKGDYDELRSEMDIVPMFGCPKCLSRNWDKFSTFHTAPTRLWRATTKCVSCGFCCKWLIDPDRTIALQSKQMHRPIGF